MKKAPSVYTVDEIYRTRSTTAVNINGKYVVCRPIGLYSVANRFRCAWLVFSGRADALIWPEGQ
jgi:hypothetical protein